MMPAITVLDFQEFQEVQEQPNLLSTNASVVIKNSCNGSNFSQPLRFPEIFVAAKTRVLPKRNPKKNIKEKCIKETSKKTKLPPLRRSKKEEVTQSFSVVSNATGSRYTLIQRKSSSSESWRIVGNTQSLVALESARVKNN